MTTNPLNAYRQTQVKTASAGRLIVMMYDEVLKQLQNAKNELEADKPRLDTAHNAIVKAQDIITELMVSLDFEKGGEIAQNLFNLYMFFNQTLIDSNLSKKSSGIAEVYNLLGDLRTAWASIEGKTEGSGVMNSGVNISG